MLASVFIATVPLEGESVRAVYFLLLGCRRDKTYGKSTVINSGILYNYFTPSAGSGSAGQELF